MNLSRRFFLGGALSVAAVSVLSPGFAHPSIPTLHADGIEDDFPAILALMRGEPVVVEGRVLQVAPGLWAELIGSRHAISRTIDFGDALRRVRMVNCFFTCMPGFAGEYAMRVPQAACIRMGGVHAERLPS